MQNEIRRQSTYQSVLLLQQEKAKKTPMGKLNVFFECKVSIKNLSCLLLQSLFCIEFVYSFVKGVYTFPACIRSNITA